ncbi:TPA: phage tail protein [Serratia odorifera]|nr:phage tail protein [Serratia odorifera]HEI8869146.1 phage tail protein [Serratia odorifera]
MSIEAFTWRVLGQPEGNPKQRVRTAQFGDGYKQVSGDGINPETQT